MNFVLVTHIFFALLAQLFTVVATAMSLVFLYRHHQLKKKKLRVLSNVSLPLDVIEKRIFQSVVLSVIFLSLGLVSGVFFILSQVSTIDHVWSKILWAFLVWAWYLVVLTIKHLRKISRVLFAQMIIMGFFLILGSFFGTVFS